MQTTIDLVRHGETAGDRMRRYQTYGTPLSGEGREQARRLAERLAHEGPFAALYTSDLFPAVVQPAHHLAGEGVQLLRPVQHDRGAAPIALKQDIVGGHIGLLLRQRRSSWAPTIRSIAAELAVWQPDARRP